MRRILLMIFSNIIIVPKMWIKLCYYAKHADKYTEKERYELLTYICDRANRGGRVHIDVHGEENIPQEGGFVFFPNHQGLFDVLAIVSACPVAFSVVAKKEIANVQFLKQVLAVMKAYIIDRGDVRQAMDVILNVSREVADGRRFLIFAEGTRSKNGNHPGEFKGGSFKSATKAKCPIIPIVLIDAFKPFDTKSVKPVKVQVHFLEPLLYSDYVNMKTTEIAAEVKRRIEGIIDKNN